MVIPQRNQGAVVHWKASISLIFSPTRLLSKRRLLTYVEPNFGVWRLLPKAILLS
jgi:hypothetical protein